MALPSYAHLLLPLPPKSIFGSMQSIAEKRIKPLEAYLQHLLTQPVPVFRNNILWQRFLSVSNESTQPFARSSSTVSSRSYATLGAPSAEKIDLSKDGEEWAAFIRQLETALTDLRGKLTGLFPPFPSLML